MGELFAIGGAAGGVALVWQGWLGRRQLAFAGWALVVVALLILAGRAGAWGIAVGASGAIAAALVVLARSAWAAPAVAVRPQRVPTPVARPTRSIGDLGRRMAVFLLVVPIGCAATQLLAFGAQAAARRGGWHDADVLALALLLQPLAWAGLASVQMTRARWPAMIAPALACAAAGLALWWPS